MKIKLFIASIIFLLSHQLFFAQTSTDRSQFTNLSGQIEGKVIDANTKNPLEYANVILFSTKDSIMIAGVASAANGRFVLDNIKPGIYNLKISFMGYESYEIKRLAITPKNLIVSIGDIDLKPKDYILKQAVVSGQKMEMNYSIDKKIINVDKTIASAGGTVIDVLENAPSVKVDVDGNISLRGNSNVTILINGRISGLTALGGSEALSSIPASSVERIEIVTNPAARYEAEGASGIINIILKKNDNIGLNGQVNLSAGNQNRYNSTIATNLKYKNWNFFLNYDARLFNFNGTGFISRNAFYNNASSLSIQNMSMKNKNFGQNGFAGLEYSFDDKSSIALNYSFRLFNPESKNFNFNQNFDPNNQLIRLFDRSSSGERTFFSSSYNLNYKKEFETKGQQLSVDLNLSNNKMELDENINQNEWDLINSNTLIAYYSQRSQSRNYNDIFIAQIDYSHPLSDSSKFETGARYSDKLLKTNNYYYDYDFNQNLFIENLISRNQFDYDEKIFASYLIYNGSLRSFKYQLGLRAEQTFINTKLRTTGQKKNDEYLSLFPSAHISYSFSRNDELKASYSRRIDRPSNRQLNPRVDYSDSLNLFKGNSNLKPQYINSYEIGYITTIGKATLNGNVFLRETNDLIGTLTKLINQNTTLTTFENLNKGRWTGVELIYTQNILPFWRTNLTASFYNVQITDNSNSGAENNSNSWTLRAASSFFFSKATQFQFSFNYNSPTLLIQQSFRGTGAISSQSKTKEMLWIDLMARQELLENKLSLALRVSDVFNTRNFDSYSKSSNFVIDSKRKMDSRMAFLSLTYNFNFGETFKPKQIKREDNQDIEM